MELRVSVPGREREETKPLDAARLLRGLGVTRKLVGFRYVVFMVDRVLEDPDRIRLITKRLYPDTGHHFGATGVSVERAVRILIRACWERADHRFLEEIAGVSMERIPSNSEFIDMLAGYLEPPC